jgi:hypothetical protein
MESLPIAEQLRLDQKDAHQEGCIRLRDRRLQRLALFAQPTAQDIDLRVVTSEASLGRVLAANGTTDLILDRARANLDGFGFRDGDLGPSRLWYPLSDLKDDAAYPLLHQRSEDER